MGKLRLRRAGLLALCLLMAAPATAGHIIELKTFVSDGWILARVRAADLLDRRSRSTIESGLPGRCIYEFEILDASGKRLLGRQEEFELSYDPWEQTYVLRSGAGARAFESLAALDSAASNPPPIRIAPLHAAHGIPPWILRARGELRAISDKADDEAAAWVSADRRKSEFHLDIALFFRRLLNQSESGPSWGQSAAFDWSGASKAKGESP